MTSILLFLSLVATEKSQKIEKPRSPCEGILTILTQRYAEPATPREIERQIEAVLAHLEADEGQPLGNHQALLSLTFRKTEILFIAESVFASLKPQGSEGIAEPIIIDTLRRLKRLSKSKKENPEIQRTLTYAYEALTRQIDELSKSKMGHVLTLTNAQVEHQRWRSYPRSFEMQSLVESVEMHSPDPTNGGRKGSVFRRYDLNALSKSLSTID